MDEIYKAFGLAITCYKQEYGADAKMEDGEEFVTVLNDAIMIISLEDNSFKIKVLCGKPYFADINLNL